MNSYSQLQLVQQNCQGKTTHSEIPFSTVRSEDFSRELEGEPGESHPTESTDDAEARADFWSIQGDFICLHHKEPRVHLYVPKEETFLIPMQYMDVTKSTHTVLDVMQEKKTDDYWNVDSCKHLSDFWRGYTKFTLLKEKPPKRIHVRLPDHIMHGQKFGRKLVKPLRIEKSRNGQRRNRSLTMLEY